MLSYAVKYQFLTSGVSDRVVPGYTIIVQESVQAVVVLLACTKTEMLYNLKMLNIYTKFGVTYSKRVTSVKNINAAINKLITLILKYVDISRTFPHKSKHIIFKIQFNIQTHNQLYIGIHLSHQSCL